MDLFPLDVLSRWVHIGTAIAILGGSIFMRFVLMPAAAALPEEQHDALRQRVMATWRKFVGIGIGLFLLSGFYNYIVVAVPQHRGDGRYHMLMGIKILISLAVFLLASALVGRAKAFEGIRRDAKKWLGVTILLAALVVAIAGYLKLAHVPAGDAADADEAAMVVPQSRRVVAALAEPGHTRTDGYLDTSQSRRVVAALPGPVTVPYPL